MPLQMIMTAANTVSRANPAFSGPDDNMTDTISATSITVTAMASTRVPNGSPTLCATTSAWCTAAKTAPASASAISAINQPGGVMSVPATSTTHASSGAAMVQWGSLLEVTAMEGSLLLSQRRWAAKGADSGGPNI